MPPGCGRSTKQAGGWRGALTSPGKIIFGDLGPNPGAFYPKKPGEEGTGEEIPRGRVRGTKTRSGGLKLGSPSLVSYGLDWPRPTSPSLPGPTSLPPTLSPAQGCRTAGRVLAGWQLVPSPVPPGLGGSDNPQHVGDVSLRHSSRSSRTFAPPVLLETGMPRHAESPARSCTSPRLTSSLFLCRLFRKVLNEARLHCNYLSKGGG